MNKESFALVTGASSGIGKEISKQLASKGINLILISRKKNQLEELKNFIQTQNNVSVKIIAADLSIIGASEDIFDRLNKEKIKVNTLVNNAGAASYGKFTETEFEVETNLLHLNIISIVQLTKLLLPKMIEDKEGKILNIASTAAFRAGPLMATYCAAKAFVLSFSEALSQELKGTGISVTTVCPGATDTGFAKAAGMENLFYFKKMNLASAKTVAEFSINSMMNKKVVAVQGLRNKVILFLTKILPRNFVNKITHRVRKNN
ncbi:MAG: SDR family oxidoreductase [Ignavibacteriae bacterium]|nr:SDR family oxidoreductase [Ignavibacteriota bacterium]NOG96839.1 SDR family oxidoreductase [Ignavibacteriota bacterium]